VHRFATNPPLYRVDSLIYQLMKLSEVSNDWSLVN